MLVGAPFIEVIVVGRRFGEEGLDVVLLFDRRFGEGGVVGGHGGETESGSGIGRSYGVEESSSSCCCWVSEVSVVDANWAKMKGWARERFRRFEDDGATAEKGGSEIEVGELGGQLHCEMKGG